ncbi:MAG: PBP1A family penicillin-binding protein [Oligoflexia bacterium]|nr:PBP1A family penicillin-binding protein [Oligoflexia bacterium]
MKKAIIKILSLITGLAILGGVIGTSILIYFSFDLPKISTLSDYNPPIPSVILSKDGTILAEIGKEKRDIAKFGEIPDLIVNAFLSAEDDNFFQHTGVDYMGVIRAFIANIKAGKVVQGGSTITQQVAKSLLLSRERSIARKIKDFLLAQKIEERFSKEEILFLYLNQVYLGGGYYGVKAAFKGYFDKDLTDATVAEAAMVAGLLVAPGRYSPYVNAERSKIRQGYVLKRLLVNNKITQEQYDQAIKEETKFRLRKFNEFKAGYFTDWVRQRVIKEVGEENFLVGGYKVQTTLDYELQKVAEAKVQKGVKELDKRQGFKGPLGELTPENWAQTHTENRKKRYQEVSQFFTINKDYKRDYEVVFEEDELQKIADYENEFLDEVKTRKVLSGFYPEDRYLNYLQNDETLKGVVEYVDDAHRLVYVLVDGVRGIIPYEGYRWGHEREISEEKKYWGYVLRPSTILKRGDLIHVRIVDKNSKIMKLIYKDRRENFAKRYKKHMKLINKQRYLRLELDQIPEAEGALVSVNHSTGEIISFVGGYDFNRSQFNRAIQSKRQPGSAFKPLLFAAALENGFNPSSIIMDSPETLGGVDSSLNWKPRNYDGKYKGPITFRNSLEQSRNVPTIKIAEQLGVPTILDFVERIGFNAKLDEDLSLALGSFGVTLVDIVKTYGIFPNGGKKFKTKSIISVTDRDGNPVIFEENDEEVLDDVTIPTPVPTTPEVSEVEKPEDGDEEAAEEVKENPFLVSLGGDQVYDPRLAYLMTNLLRGVVLHGTGRSARDVSLYIGGKTGTTNNYVDAWFIGFSSNVSTGVWTGFDDNKTIGWPESGAKASLPIWRGYMKESIKKYGEKEFRVPIGIVNVKVDKDTGKPVKNNFDASFMESFVEGTEPGAKNEEATKEEPSDNINNILEEDDFYNNQ